MRRREAVVPPVAGHGRGAATLAMLQGRLKPGQPQQRQLERREELRRGLVLFQEPQPVKQVVEQREALVAVPRQLIGDFHEIGGVRDLDQGAGDVAEHVDPVAGMDEGQRAVGTLLETQLDEREGLQNVQEPSAGALGPLGDAPDLAEIPRQKRDDLVRFPISPGPQHDGRARPYHRHSVPPDMNGPFPVQTRSISPISLQIYTKKPDRERRPVRVPATLTR